jgi:hypothetical protein
MTTIITKQLPPTNKIGVRVAATDEAGNRAFELWDYNADAETNHQRAAKLVAGYGREVTRRTARIGGEFEWSIN